MRGILPKGFISIPPEASPVYESNITYIKPLDFHVSSGTYYGDASGGDHTAYPDIRRVGVSFVKVDSTGHVLFGAKFPLIGDIQTVSRGELTALVELVKHAEDNITIDFVTDNKGVSDNYNAGSEKAMLTSNCDLFHELYLSVRRKNISLTVRWMPSHLSRGDERPEGVSELDVIGNSHADFYAGEAARDYQVSDEVAENCIKYYKETSLIQNRIAAVIMSLPPRQRYQTVCTPKEVKQTLQDIINVSPHQLVQEGSRFTCKNCSNSFLSSDPSFRHWLGTACIVLPTSSRPTPLMHNPLHVGNQYVHHSHKLAIYLSLIHI